jgi:hypothetical protein
MTFQPASLLRTVKDHSHWLTSWPVFVLFFVGLCIWCWVDVRLRGYPYLDQPDEHKTDLTVFTEAGAAFFDGRKPYQVSNVRGWTYLYPPLFAMLMAPLHALQTQDQVTVWFFISVLFLWGIYREIGRIVECLSAGDCPNFPGHHACMVGENGTVPFDAGLAWQQAYPWLGVAAFCAAFLPTLNCLQRGQVGVLKLYLLLLGFRLLVARGSAAKRVLGGIVLALPIVLKLVPVLPVGLLLFVLGAAWLGRYVAAQKPVCRRRLLSPIARFLSPIAASSPFIGDGSRLLQVENMARVFLPATLGVILGGFLFFFAVPAALVGWNANLRHLQTWSRFISASAEDGGGVGRAGNSQVLRNQSLHNAVFRLGNFIWYYGAAGPDDRLVEHRARPEMPMDAPAVGHILLAVRLTVLIALLLTGVRLARQGDGLSLATALGLGCVAMLVVSPISRGHYFLLFVPGILFVPWWCRCRGGSRAAWGLAAAPIAIIDLHYFILPVSGRLGLLGLGTVAWLLAAMRAVARGVDASNTLSLPQTPPANALPAGKKAA